MSNSALQEELKQNKPFASLGQEVALSILRTADVLRTEFSSRIAPFGITAQQFNVLRILRGAEPPRGLPTLEIGERLVERSPGITRLIDTLERSGLVERARCTVDRRVVYCRITREGLDLLAELDPIVREEDIRATSMLNEREHQTLLRLLDRIRNGTK